MKKIFVKNIFEISKGKVKNSIGQKEKTSKTSKIFLLISSFKKKKKYFKMLLINALLLITIYNLYIFFIVALIYLALSVWDSISDL